MCRSFIAVVLAVVFAAYLSPISDSIANPEPAGPPDKEFGVTALSTKPWLVSGGDVLVDIRLPRTVPEHQVRVTLNGSVDVTSAFHPVAGRRALRGLVTGLAPGSNTLDVTANGRGKGRPSATLDLTNWPITGPIISGPHEQPFFCQTEQFRLGSGALGGETLGPPLDENCSVATRVDYLYKSTDGTLEVLPLGPYPNDVAETTTNEGNTVPYIVRLETGTINRAIYEIAFLHQPGMPLPDPFARTPGWNGRLVYRQGGGCRRGWHIQGSDTGGVLIDDVLARGYATAAASLNRYRNNCADILSSETTMMVKEHFVEQFGVPQYTLGTGSSGGSYQSHQTADNYPGVFDGILIGRSFPEVGSATVQLLSDARLLKHYFDDAIAAGTVPWTEEQQRAVAGFGVFA
ncbi:MAG: tannase/feruloyl esterase family alpha/beta hydrolase, partial [Alphaproteobacteria bacterium]|nr:tannase/feruloyl esterase family alpha/beta hydrolase [Alphaproteobacteria bacterium]